MNLWIIYEFQTQNNKQITVMKIRKTIPSIITHSPSNANNYSTQSPMLVNNSLSIPLPDFLLKLQSNGTSISRKSGSPRKPIFGDNNRSKSRSPDRIVITGKQNDTQRVSGAGYKKAVTFGQTEPVQIVMPLTHTNNSSLVARNSQSPNRRSRYSVDPKYKRKSIFDKSNKNQNKAVQPAISKNQKVQATKNINPVSKQTDISRHNRSNTIQVNLSVKQISERLKQKQDRPKQQNLIDKITELEKVVKMLNNKIDSKIPTPIVSNNIVQVKRAIKTDTNQIKNSNIILSNSSRTNEQHQNKVLQLQLEQLRRCEQIARQNQMLYGRLVMNLDARQQQSIANSRKSSTKPYENRSRNNSNSKYAHDYQTNSNRKGPRITAFEDFHHEDQRGRENTEQNEQTEITSPFLLQDNRGTIKISR